MFMVAVANTLHVGTDRHLGLALALAPRCTAYPIATACLGRLPAAISVLMFWFRAAFEGDLMSGMATPDMRIPNTCFQVGLLALSQVA